MSDKTQPLGVCDLCGAAIPEARWYTSGGKPRRYCSVECRNAGNSHEGEPVRYAKLLARVERGEWRNPAELNPPTPEEQARRAKLGRLREVRAGTWRNPALSDEARAKLSKPRKHSGVLAEAIDKMDRGYSMPDLIPEEQEAIRAWRRELQRRRRKADES